MNRRHFLTGALAAAAAAPAYGQACYAGRNACRPIRISGLSLQPSRPASDRLNEVRGTLRFRVDNDRSDRSLTAYGGLTRGVTWQTTDRQCTELIKRYAYVLGFRNFSRGPGRGDLWLSGPAMGDAHQVAQRFASDQSDGGFVFVSNGSAATPKAGAVLSIAPYNGNRYGHVGILCNVDSSDVRRGEVRVKLFDQNTTGDAWKEVRFTLRNGRWFGDMMMNGGAYPASGWANPRG